MKADKNSDQFQKAIHQAMRAWHTIGGSPESLLSDLLLVQQKTPAAQETNPASQRLAANQVLLAGMEELAAHDEMAERVLQLRFPDNCSLLMVANRLNVSEHTVSRLQKAALQRLAEIIFSQEAKARDINAQSIEVHLPPASYTQLFGVTTMQQELNHLLQQPDGPWVIAIVGLGGVGKTALADSVTRQMIRQFCFDDVIWLRIAPMTMSGLSASPELTFDHLVVELFERFWPGTTQSPDKRLAHVRQHLQSRPYLIVIDNIESETDTSYLLERLNGLANPSKFLLTSRTRPHQAAMAYSFTVEELSFSDAVALMDAHAQEVGIRAFGSAEAVDYEDIYAKTGGNPLALKLVVSLLDLLPLSQVLGGLAVGQAGAIEAMYRYIYWQTWQTLSENGRTLLLTMPLVAESGGTPDYLKTLSNLDDAQLWPAVHELRSRSLLEVRGTLKDKRYGIHRLTETFLQTEIIHWPGVG